MAGRAVWRHVSAAHGNKPASTQKPEEDQEGEEGDERVTEGEETRLHNCARDCSTGLSLMCKLKSYF